MCINDVVQPQLLGTDSFKSSNEMICGIHKEFTVKVFLIIIGEILHIWKGVIYGCLKLSIESCGYASSIDTSFVCNSTKNHLATRINMDICVGPVKTPGYPILPPMSVQFWEHLKGTMVKRSKITKEIMHYVCEEKGYHPTMILFWKVTSFNLILHNRIRIF